MKCNPIAFLLLLTTIGLPAIVLQPEAAIAQSTRNRTNTYITGRLLFKTPGGWVQTSSNGRTITLYNYKMTGGGAAPVDLLRLDASVVTQNLESTINSRNSKRRRGTPPKIIKSSRQTIDSVPALIEYSSDENSDFMQNVTFYIRHSDRSTAIISINYDPSNSNAEKIIGQIQNSIKIRANAYIS